MTRDKVSTTFFSLVSTSAIDVIFNGSGSYILSSSTPTLEQLLKKKTLDNPITKINHQLYLLLYNLICSSAI